MNKQAIKKEVQIGDCRLILGDCLEVMPLLGEFDAVVTDPPYGMAFNSNHRLVAHRPIANDAETDLLIWACQISARHSKYIFCRWDNLQDIPKPKSLITWVKNNHSMGDLKHEHGRKTEVCAFYHGEDHSWPCERPADVLFGTRTGNELHPTQKPVDLMRNVVSWTRGAVCDPFMGSGTTLVACAKMGRKGTGIELDPEYFEIACQRVRDAYAQPDMFVQAPQDKPEQTSLLEAIGADK